jgi:hypothetical protein
MKLADGDNWEPILNTEGERYSVDLQPIEVQFAKGAPVVRFERAGAVILRERDPRTR